VRASRHGRAGELERLRWLNELVGIFDRFTK
jgi:hypothetical protein